MSKANRNRRPAGLSDVEIPDWAKPNAQPPGVDWLTLLGFQLGEEIVIFPIGITGQSLGGQLVDIALNPNGSGPTVVTIRNAEGRPNVSIPWTSIMMITKAEGPKVDVPSGPMDISLEDLAQFAQEQGYDVPVEVWDEINNPAAGIDDTKYPEA